MMVKQYDMISSYMAESPSGMYVLRKDYQTLEAERDALKELNGELMTVLEDIQSMDDSSLWEQNDTVSYIAKFARQAINKAREVMDEM